MYQARFSVACVSARARSSRLRGVLILSWARSCFAVASLSAADVLAFSKAAMCLSRCLVSMPIRVFPFLTAEPWVTSDVMVKSVQASGFIEIAVDWLGRKTALSVVSM